MSNATKFIQYPVNAQDYFFYNGLHYFKFSNRYYESSCINKYSFISAFKERCWYEKIGKKIILRY